MIRPATRERPRPTRRRAARCAVLAVLALAACSERPVDLVLVSVDTLRADRVGLLGAARPTTPNVDRWFADGAIYERAYSAAASTSPSVVSLLTGLLPQDHRVRLFYQLLGEKTKLLTAYLPPAYQKAAFVSNIVLTDEALGIADRFDHYDDFVDERESERVIFERRASRTTDAALRWLAERADPDRPLFLWVHYIDPHGPYRPPESFRERFEHDGAVVIDPKRVPGYTRDEGVSDGLHYVDRYDDEVAYVDTQVGRLLDGLDALRPLDGALTVFTADHGESMMEHDKWFTHGYQVYEEIVHVPLLLRGAGVQGGRSRAVVSLVDVAPTLIRAAGGTPPESLVAVDLRQPTQLDPERVAFVEASASQWFWRAAVQGDGKWLMALAPSGQVTRRRYFDLALDPGETQPKRWPKGVAARELGTLRRRDPDPAGSPHEYRQGLQIGAPKVAPDASPEAIEALRALGYVE